MKKSFYLLSFLVFIVFVAVTINACKNADNPINGKSTAVFNPNATYSTLIDQDGNVYKTTTIGNQTWMAENLKVTHYSNGDTIPIVTSNSKWIVLKTGAFCNYNNTKNLDTIGTFGRLYNWYAITDTRKIAPAGWHVPTDAEWQTLVDFLGSENHAGGKIKEVNSTHWKSPNINATNESGFTALPAGYRDYGAFAVLPADIQGNLYPAGSFNGIDCYTDFWSFTPSSYNTSDALVRALYFDNDFCGLCAKDKGSGFSVRLVKN